MAYVSKFKTDTAYGADDINEITSILTGEGVAPNTPNDVLEPLAGAGVTAADEQCAVTWKDNSHTSVNIGAGTVIMSDGSYIVIYNHELPVDCTQTQYIYIVQDIILHNIPQAGASLPEGCVPLARIENGVIYDMRVYSRSKIENYGKNIKLVQTVSNLTDGSQISLPDNTARYNYAVIVLHDPFGGMLYPTENSFPLFDFSALSFLYPRPNNTVSFKRGSEWADIKFENNKFKISRDSQAALTATVYYS